MHILLSEIHNYKLLHVKTYLVKVWAVLIENGVIIVSASQWAEIGVEYVRASSVEKRLQVNLKENICFAQSLFEPHPICQITLLSFWFLYLTQFGTKPNGVGEITKLFSTTGVKTLPWLGAYTISLNHCKCLNSWVSTLPTWILTCPYYWFLPF